MKKILFILFILSVSFTQNYNEHLWSGISVSTSDNLDALNLNPAGLGFNRGNQSAIVFKQIPDGNGNYYIGMSNRYDSGFATELYYDEESISSVIAYGTSIAKNVYSGFKYHSKTDYSTGLLFRPHNTLSIGVTKFSDKIRSYDYLRYGFAFRPFSLNRFSNKANYSTSLPKNVTFGYDKTGSELDNSFQEQYFISGTITPGIDVSIFKFNKTDNDSYGFNISFNIGNNGVQINNYPSNSYFNATTASSSIALYDYSQKIESKLNDFNKKTKYVELKLDGYFIEEKPRTSPFDFLIDFNPIPFLGTNNGIGIQLKSWIDDIDMMSKDSSVEGLIIHLGNVRAGMAKRKEMFNALMRFKNENKKIIVYAENGISGSDYYLVSMADEIYIHHLNGVDLKGFNLEVTYLNQLLDTLSITPEVVRVSPYKTGPETLIRESMSDEFRENYGELLDGFYNTMVRDISKAKGWTIERTENTIDLGPYWMSYKAIDKELITNTMFPDQFESYINDLKNKKTSVINWNDYNRSEKYSYDWKPDSKPKIAIIYAVGGIISGKSNPGPAGSTLMGDQTIKKAIKNAREDKDIDAIVLRIDSGGGSGLASDMMWREVYKTTVEDTSNIKPFIVSMSDAAASGGYYIACQADKIVADETTVTGSIGVYYVRINFSELLNRVGVYTDNIKKGERGDFGSASHLLTDEERNEAFENIMSMYNTFKQRVIDGRENLNDIDELDDIALGRVWTGLKAKEHGLVDEIGGLHDAIEIARKEANIEDNRDIDIIELPEISEFNFFNIFNDDNTSINLTKLSLIDLFPEEMAQKLEALNIVPVIMNDEIQLIMPYSINVN